MDYLCYYNHFNLYRHMRVLFAIFIGWLLINLDMWDSLIEIGLYVFVGWFAIKSYQAIKESLKP